MKKQIKPVYYIAFLIIYLEIMFKVLVLKNIEFNHIVYTIIFSIPKILLLGLICNIFNKKGAKIFLPIVSFIITFYFLIQLVFFKLFSVPFSFTTLGLAENALGFTDIIFDAIKAYFFYIVAFIIPLIAYIPLSRVIKFEKQSKKHLLKTAIAIVIIFVILIGIIHIDKKRNLFAI